MGQSSNMSGFPKVISIHLWIMPKLTLLTYRLFYLPKITVRARAKLTKKNFSPLYWSLSWWFCFNPFMDHAKIILLTHRLLYLPFHRFLSSPFFYKRQKKWKKWVHTSHSVQRSEEGEMLSRRSLFCPWYSGHSGPVSYTHLTLPTTPYV